MDFNFPQCIPLVLDAVASDSFDRVALFVGCVLHQVDQAEATVFAQVLRMQVKQLCGKCKENYRVYPWAM